MWLRTQNFRRRMTWKDLQFKEKVKIRMINGVRLLWINWRRLVKIQSLARLENSAVNIAESIQQGGIPSAGSTAPSLIDSGKAFTAKGMQVLELVGKETMDLLITETGIEVDKKGAQAQDDEDQLFEEVTFGRCFYIYGGIGVFVQPLCFVI